ncbi:MAG: hypothetical protein JWO40_426 [Candidatus Doudnabacteria bacterium]|nr:hypothetical protein [Candidatus Doudnabacteria bacterium]
MHKNLKKIVHPNRYFIWTIFLISIVAAGLISFIIISGINLDNQNVFSELKTKKIYIDNQAGYSVRYPNNWQIERDQNGNTVFENPQSTQENLTVTSAGLDLENVIRHSIKITTEKDIAKDNLKIAIIKAASAKDGSDLDIAIIKNQDKLFYISGYSPTIEVFARNFKVQ